MTIINFTVFVFGSGFGSGFSCCIKSSICAATASFVSYDSEIVFDSLVALSFVVFEIILEESDELESEQLVLPSVGVGGGGGGA